MAAFSASTHLLRVMVNRGFVSPNEVDEIYSTALECIQAGDEEFAATFESNFGPAFAELRQWAEKQWIGRGKTNPR